MRNEREQPDADDLSDTEKEALRAEAVESAIEEALEESFPASDPPSWEPLRSGPPKNCEPEADSR